MRYRWVAGLVATLASMLSLTVVANPAVAVNPMADLSIVAPSAFHQGDTHNVVVKLDSMSTGLNDQIAVSLTVSNASEVATLDFAVTKVTVGPAYCPSLTNDGFTCTFPYDGSPNVAITFTIKNNTDTAPTGGSKIFDKSLIQVNDLTFVTVTTSLSQYFSLTVLGPPKATTISGETDDITGRPVPGALVNLHDSASPAHSYSAHTDSTGKFSFPADTTHPVAAGQVFVSASKNGYRTRSSQKNFTPGTPISGWKLLVTPIAVATPTPTSTSTQTSSATPTTPPSGAEASPINGLSEPVFGSDAALASPNSGAPDLFKYVLVGGLIMILAAIAIIVMMLIRRRRTDDGGEDDGGYPQPRYDTGYAPAVGRGLPPAKSYRTSPYSYDDVGRS